MPRITQKFELDRAEREQLQRWQRNHTTEQRLAFRASIILLLYEGKSVDEVAGRCNTSRQSVWKWKRRFLKDGVEGLYDSPRFGRPRKYDEEKEKEIVSKTLKQPEVQTHWSARRLAREVGVSHMTVHRVWKRYDLQPHRIETFKYSKDPQLVEKVADIVGLYLHPPEGAMVLCVDEKSQIQALDRTQPMLPLGPGLPARQTHDYKRNGTTSLFAALDIATGKVVGTCKKRHRHQEFLSFLNLLNRQYPKREVHLIMDNYSTHKHDKVREWFGRHPRFQLHFTPTSASWMNQVETWFSILTRQRIRRGSFRSVRELVDAIKRFIENWNGNGNPFRWTKSSDTILAKAIRKGINDT
ncbi:MAG: IS630 family transposase [Bacteroidetes bacterium]|nr:IS630 family transposase [Bacteroidota bacterium]